MSQYCFARWRLSSVVVCNTAGGRADRTIGAQAVGWLTLYGGPVVCYVPLGRHLVFLLLGVYTSVFNLVKIDEEMRP